MIYEVSASKVTSPSLMDAYQKKLSYSAVSAEIVAEAI